MKKKRIANSFLGFTLVELLITIAIMAVLLAIVIPNFLGARERSRDSKLKSEFGQLKSALRMYYNDYQKYPAHNINGLIVGCGASGDLVCPQCSSFEFAAGGTDGCSTVYMKKLPVSSYSGGELKYNQLSNGDAFSVCANLENTSDPDGAASRDKCTATIDVGNKNTYCVCSD